MRILSDKKNVWSWTWERTRLKCVRIRTEILSYSITRIWKCGRNTKIRNRPGISGLTETGKIWDFELSGTKLDFEFQFVLQIATQTVETRLSSELEEKDEKCFTGADATLVLWALGENKNFV